MNSTTQHCNDTIYVLILCTQGDLLPLAPCSGRLESSVISDYFHRISSQIWIENTQEKWQDKKPKKRCQENISLSLAKGNLREKVKRSFLIN